MKHICRKSINNDYVRVHCLYKTHFGLTACIHAKETFENAELFKGLYSLDILFYYYILYIVIIFYKMTGRKSAITRTLIGY